VLTVLKLQLDVDIETDIYSNKKVVSRHIILRLSIITSAASSLAVDYTRLLLDYIYNNISSLHTKYAGDMPVSHIYIPMSP
jgi:hypothetical protein